MAGKNESNSNKNGVSFGGFKPFGSIHEKAFFRRAKSAVIACICATLIFAVSLNIPTAYAAWFNGNSKVSAVDVETNNGTVETAADTSEPSGFGSFVTAFTDSKLEYVVYVDGIEAGAVDSIDDLNGILDGFIERYTTENTVSADIEQNISTKCVYVESPVLFGTERLKKALDPDNTGSACRLTVRTVETYDASYSVPYKTVEFDDPDLYEGETEIVTEGADGFISKTVSDTLVNGEIVKSSVVSCEVVTDTVNEVIANGTRLLTASNGYYIWPADGIMTSDYGPRNVTVGSTFHKGIDIVGQYAQDIWAADGGEVVYADWLSGYGYLVQILHDNGEKTYYGHCCELLVSVGERVYQGQVIAHMGATGTATAVHVHFEIRIDGVQVDPLPFLSK